MRNTVRALFLLCGLGMTLAPAGGLSAQSPWRVIIQPGATPLPIGNCTGVRLEVLDAGGAPARNSAGSLISMADFDWSVAPVGKVVGRYDGARAWAVCACPGSAGVAATITATYPAQALALKARMPELAFQSSITAPVAAVSNSSGVPIGCEQPKTTTVAAGGTAPWTTTLITGRSPLPIGNCTPVSIDLRNGKEVARHTAGRVVSLADFDMSVSAEGGSAAVGQSGGPGSWSACACQGSKIGAAVTITASYPATALAEAARAPGVAFRASVPMPLGPPPGTANPPGCLTVITAVAPITTVAASTPVPAPAPVTAITTVVPATATPVTATAPRSPPTGVAAAPSTAGPAPQNIKASSPWTPLAQRITWDPLPGVSGYTVSIKLSASVADWTLLPGTPGGPVAPNQWGWPTDGPVGSMTFADPNFRQPGTMYRVTALYPDGRQGSTDLVYNNPSRLAVPGKFSARLFSPGTVRLSWDDVLLWGQACGSGGCLPVISKHLPSRVMGPGQPADGTLVPYVLLGSLVDNQFLDIANLPPGNYTWRITADYGGIYETAGLPSASITLTPPPPPPPPAKFRVSILGFKAIVETDDDLLSRDGKNNEVYAAATVCRADRLVPTTMSCALIRSAVHGDINGFPTRIQAGTGSATGGITSGNSVGAGPSGTTAGSTNSFPYLLWEGWLSPGREAVWIAPSLWESGGVDTELRSFYSGHQSNLNSGYRQSTTPGIAGVASSVLGGGLVPMNTSPYYCGLFMAGNDRPIGVGPVDYSRVNSYYGITANLTPGLVCNVIGLTREKAEAVLAAAPQEPDKPAGVFTMDLIDAIKGHYFMYLKLERLP